MGVITMPGLTTLLRTPSGPHSLASRRLQPIDLTISFGMRAPHRPGPHGRHGKHGIATAMPRAKASLAARPASPASD